MPSSPTLCLPNVLPGTSWCLYGTAAETCFPEYYSWVRDTQHLRVPLCICFRCVQRSCPGPSAGPLKNMAHDSGQPGLLDAKVDSKNITVTTWLTIITIVCSECEHVLSLSKLFVNPIPGIFVWRTWALWERSRKILFFLIGLTAVQ